MRTEILQFQFERSSTLVNLHKRCRVLTTETAQRLTTQRSHINANWHNETSQCEPAQRNRFHATKPHNETCTTDGVRRLNLGTRVKLYGRKMIMFQSYRKNFAGSYRSSWALSLVLSLPTRFSCLCLSRLETRTFLISI